MEKRDIEFTNKCPICLDYHEYWFEAVECFNRCAIIEAKEKYGGPKEIERIILNGKIISEEVL